MLRMPCSGFYAYQSCPPSARHITNEAVTKLIYLAISDFGIGAQNVCEWLPPETNSLSWSRNALMRDRILNPHGKDRYTESKLLHPGDRPRQLGHTPEQGDRPSFARTRLLVHLRVTVLARPEPNRASHSKLEAHLRRVEARTFVKLFKTIGDSLQPVRSNGILELLQGRRICLTLVSNHFN